MLSKFIKGIARRLISNRWLQVALDYDLLILNPKRERLIINALGISLKKGDHLFILESVPLLERLVKAGFQLSLEKDKVFLQSDYVKINVETREDIFIFNEIFNTWDYNFLLPTQQSVVVIDIGMNVGMASLYFASQPTVTKVYSFEPFERTFHQAKYNFSINPVFTEKIAPHNFGLSSEDSTQEVYYNYENKGRVGIWGTELIKNSFTTKEVVKLFFKDVSVVLNEIFLAHQNCVFVLKIDCEGSEYDIFENFESSGLLNDSRVKALMMEWHIKGNKPLETILIKTGFNVFSKRLSSNLGFIYACR
jgi:FkbM family methyltransferase